MKIFDTPWTSGSLLICNKCGKSFGRTENADLLKFDLKSYLKETESHKKIRVMVTGCLDVCQKDEQAVVFHPIKGKAQVFTVVQDYKTAFNDLKEFLNKKI